MESTIAGDDADPLAKEIERQNEAFDKNQQKHEYKWRQILQLRNEQFEAMKERQREDDEEMERKKSQAEAQRKMSVSFPRLSRQSLEDDRRQKAEQIRQEALKLKQREREEKLQRLQDQKKWFNIIRDMKNMQQISRREKDEELLRERAKAQEKQQEMRERLAMEREMKKVADEEWQRRMSDQVKHKTAKRKKKRKQSPDMKSLSRFRLLQLEAEKRLRKQNLRKKRQEEKLLQKKKKRYEKELVRREEVAARLEHMKKIRDMNDMKRMAELEKEDKRYEAQYSVYEAQKKLLAEATEQLKKHAQKKRREKSKIIKMKVEAVKVAKIRQELLRRTAVSTNVAKYRQKARLLALRRAEQLATEEVEWKSKKKSEKAYNQWVRLEWSKRVQRLNELQLKKLVMLQEREENDQLDKIKKELDRRTKVESRIVQNRQKLEERKKSDKVNESTQAVRQQFLVMEKKEHDRKIRINREQRCAVALSAKKLAEENRRVYIQDREQQLQKNKNMKNNILKNPTKKVWK